MKKNIVLIGMSGCGKTTIGKMLADKLEMSFYDTDELIEIKQNKKIKDIFSESGEAFFRELETEAAKETSKLENAVISTGGGMILKPENMNFLKQNSLTVYLKRTTASINKTMDASGRPLLANGVDKLYEMEKIRSPLYEKYADLVVINEQTPEKTVSEIENAMM